LIDTLVLDKTHDEKRQGEAYAAAPIGNTAIQKHFYIESYGCAMNFADSEVVASILQEHGYGATTQTELADLILINTCSIREKAEQTVRKRLTEFKQHKRAKPEMLIGVLGCMAERLKAKFLEELKAKFLEEEKLVDLVVGPDAYRSLPALVEEANGGQKAVNVLLSRDETYADIAPIRLNSNGVTAFVSIMRGCNNMCSFCVVPFTRGRERSRDANSIVKECEALFNEGYREVTLRQNVDSYHFIDESNDVTVSFAKLMQMVAKISPLLRKISPLLRVRFSTSHPKDITDEVLLTMKQYDNICNYIHLPVQSGSTRVLQMMNRTYSREWYISKVDRIRELLPDCGLSTDMITGFCTETEEEHKESLSLMEYCKFELAYMYFYSERPGTLAARRFEDDVPLETKKRRLQEMVALHREMVALHRIHSLEGMQKEVGKTFKVLVEGTSKKSEEELYGRNDQNKVVVFPKHQFKKGDYVMVNINSCTAGTLIGEAIIN